MNETPRGRPPKCYAKAYRFVECEACAWRYRCNPKPVPVQMEMHWDKTVMEECPPFKEDRP